MAHNILEKDACIIAEGEPPCWHHLEKVVPEITYETSGLNWTVEKQAIVLKDSQVDVPTHFAIYCPEKNQIINVAKDSYTIIPNSQLFDTIHESLTGINYKITSAVSLGNLRQVAVTVVLSDQQDYLVNKEEFKNYLTFVTSHSGEINFTVFDSSIRAICRNSLQWSLKDKGILNMKVRHTKNSSIKIENMKEEVEKLFKKREEFYQTYEGLMIRPMSSERAEQIIAGFEAAEELSTRSLNKVKAIHDLFLNGKGNKGETVADLLNGFTEYYSGQSSRDPAKAWASSEFGQGRDKKLEVWEIVNSPDAMDKLARRGEALLV